ncbi:MAG TPA: type II toxin-antitoxin system RelE/ParE family toxin [Clostridia bacterium]|nr:type II toxin-antitoxin system RelE/ParE family toxin [Clostridia bacterium]
MTFDFHEDALREYEEAGHWYEEQRRRLGIEFTEAIDSAIALILEEPERHRSVGQYIRVFRVKRFPFHIFYKYYPHQNHVRVLAIAHFKRRPGYWQARSDETAG